MDMKRAMPAFILGALGFVLMFFGLFLFLSGSNDLSLRARFVLIIGGLLLVAFAIFYARNENEYKDEDDFVRDEVEIIWEEVDEDEADEHEYDDDESDDDKVDDNESRQNESSEEK